MTALHAAPQASGSWRPAWRRSLGLLVLVLVVGLIAAPAAAAQTIAQPHTLRPRVESRVEARVFYSPVLGESQPYFIYLPPGYDSQPAAHFPVLYLLHGMGGSNTEWRGYGAFDASDRLMKSGEIAPHIIVLPQGDQGFWFDHPAPGRQWGTYVAQDVVREIDQHFRTIPDRDHRAVGGLSMGAYGALHLGITFPNVFGIVGSHAPPLRDYETALEWMGESFVGDRSYFEAHDPVTQFHRNPGVASTLKIWLDVGAEDANWLGVVDQFHQQLLTDGVPHQYQILPGQHNGDEYWGPHTPKYLRFYDAALRG